MRYSVLKRYIVSLLVAGALLIGVPTAQAAQVVLLPSFLTIQEGSAKKMVSITLAKRPAKDVTIKVKSPADDNGLVALGKRTFTFKANEAPTPQEFGVTLSAAAKKSDSTAIVFEGSDGSEAYTGSMTVTVIAEGATPNTIQPENLPGSSYTIEELFNKGIGYFLTLVALAAFASLIYSGILYITAAGDTGQAEKARKNIQWALISVFLVAVSYLAVRLVSEIVQQQIKVERAATEQGEALGSGEILVSDLTGQAVEQYFLPDGTGSMSIPLDVALKSAPASPVTVEVVTRGKLPVSVSTNSITLDETSYKVGERLVVSYGGNGNPGEAAEVIVKSGEDARYVIRIIYPDPAAPLKVPVIEEEASSQTSTPSASEFKQEQLEDANR